ncbi:MAG TPA: 2TM domain-containing protein [Streptosporangiaceae bacterium]|nr:2TM domain-containing protein [Streptosporangiaceae bacterium]
MTKIIEDTPADTGLDAAAGDGQEVRQQAIKQIERRRRYWIHTAIATVGMLLLAAIWAVTEYHNAGGWPTQGFSQSSGIHDVWNIWIIYPAIAWAFITTAYGLAVYLRKPISESKIQREIERQEHASR